MDILNPYLTCDKCRPIIHPPKPDLEPYEPCWVCKYDHPPDTKVKLQNPKFCWLYPERRRQKLEKLLPKFEHCKTLYTKCDYRLEQCAHEQILKLEDELKNYNELLNKELDKQKILIKSMWKQSQRYMMLTISGCCMKPYPDVVSNHCEKRALCDFYKDFKKINISNCALSFSLGKIRESLSELNQRCCNLDHTVESPFIKGNYYLQPLQYYRDLIDDLFTYFHGVLCKLKCWAQLILATDSGTIEDYLALLMHTSDFEGFLMVGLEECKCRRSNQTECIRRHIPCYCRLQTACRQKEVDCYKIQNL